MGRNRISKAERIINGNFEDYISNMTKQDEDENYVMCHECRSYIRHSQYWVINEEVLCDDCAKAKYLRGVEGRYEEL